MNLYKLTLILEQYKGHKWDAMYGIVVAADSSKEAREIANKSTLCETEFDLEDEDSRVKHNNIWLKAKYTKIQKIGVAAKGIKKGSILEDVHWG